jgi:MFS family permease
MPLKAAIRARNATWAAFGIMGVISMGWVPRIPEIKETLGLSNGEFGLVLLGTPVGAIIGAQLAGRVIHAIGSRPVGVISALVMSAGPIAVGFSNTAQELFLALTFGAFGYAALDVCMNTQAVAIERIANRAYMSSFHGAWSIGSLVGTVLSGSVAYLTTPKQNLIAIGVIAMPLLTYTTTRLLPRSLDNHSGGEVDTAPKIPLFEKKTLVVWLLGLGMVGSLIPEAAASDWGAILLYEDMGIAKGINAAAFGCFAAAMIYSRFRGDVWLTKYGADKVVRVGGYVGGITFGLSILIAVELANSSEEFWVKAISLVIVCVGFTVAGIGIGPMIPAFISAAGRIPDVAPSVAIARLGVISLAAFFIGPSLGGGLAELSSLPLAMMFPAISLVLAGYLSKSVAVKTE